jgi:hypothetical protein
MMERFCPLKQSGGTIAWQKRKLAAVLGPETLSVIALKR